MSSLVRIRSAELSEDPASSSPGRLSDVKPSVTTASRAAQLDHQRRLCDGVERLTAALDQVRTAVAEHREEARRIEVRNVALMES